MTKLKLLVISFVFMVVMTSCSKKQEVDLVQEESDNTPVIAEVEEVSDEIESQSEPEEDTHEGQALNPLTGLYISEEAAARRPIGIMINNLEAALPQSGISQADIMYETLVEGSICRLFAVFQDFDAKKIGPVRSARHYFLDFAFDFDAIYVHYGQSPQALAAFSELDAPNMNGLSYLDTIMCFQDPERVRPHSTYTSFDGLMAAWESVQYRQERDESIDTKLKFNEEDYLLGGTTANKVTLPFSSYHESWFEYDSETKLYNRFQFDGEQIDKETGEQLTYKNIIIQLADMWVIAGDKEGRMDMNLVSEGRGYYISNGQSIEITWSKASHYEPTHYYLTDGSELLLNKGKTWIAVFPNYREDYIKFE